MLYIFNVYVTASEYYVTAYSNDVPSDWNRLPCHNFSYYILDFKSCFTNDTMFYFLAGTDTLKGTLEISGVI